MNLRAMSKTMIQIAIACVVLGLSAWGVSQITENILDISTKLGQILQVGLSTGVGAIAYIILAALMKMDEYIMVKDIIKRRRQRKNLKQDDNNDIIDEENNNEIK